MTFNIGNQHAAVVNNVAGDQTVHGGQHGYVMVPPEVIAAVRAVRAHLSDLDLDADDHARADADLANLDHQLITGQTTHRDTADRLSRLLTAARQAGAIITAASSLGTAITTIAHWLGPVGTTLLHLLG
jgi:hypothetical protein